MDYSLAKQLKEAGFPQLFKIGGWMHHNGSLLQRENLLQWTDPEHLTPNERDDIYIPTLSELIEACGNRFCSVGRTTAKGGTKNSWLAIAWIKGEIGRYSDTPEEAVARLWLALYGKQKEPPI